MESLFTKGKSVDMLRLLLPIILLGFAQLLHPPYPPGSHYWCFDSSRCLDGECCMPVTEPDGPLGKRGAAPPGRCFNVTSELKGLCMKTRSQRALAHRCNDGFACGDDECCVEWAQSPGIGKRFPQFFGVCEKLGHYDSDCRPDHYNDSNNARPDGLVKSCPCDQLFNCTRIDDDDITKGICT